jgi:colanic acid biosynthesis glycosyl transferase WcaI
VAPSSFAAAEKGIAEHILRILALSINYWPDETGIAAFNIWRCEYLASQGHQVTICTGPPYYPQWRVPTEYRGKLIQREERNGVTILRSWMFVPQRPTTARRMLHEASFLVTSFLRALAGPKPDLIFAVSPPLGLGLTATALARLWRVPYIFDVEDLQPDAAVELGMMTKGPLTDFLYKAEWRAYQGAALISTLTEGMRQRIVEKGIDAAKVTLFPPRADSSLYTLRERIDGSAFREKHGLRGKFIVSHSGNMGVKQGMEVILSAAEKSRANENIHYLFVGDGAMRAKLEAEARTRNLRNILILALLENDEFSQMLAATDIALITQKRIVSDIVFPSKTVTLLFAGCPVIASVNSGSEVARAVRRSGAGLVVEPENADALWNAIRELAARPESLARMSQRAREFALESWDEKRTLPLMEAEFTQCVEAWRNRPGEPPPRRESAADARGSMGAE